MIFIKKLKIFNEKVTLFVTIFFHFILNLFKIIQFDFLSLQTHHFNFIQYQTNQIENSIVHDLEPYRVCHLSWINEIIC